MQGPQQTNDLGEFRIAGLAPGEYVIAAVPRGGFGGPGIAPPSPGAGARTTAVTTFYPGTTDQAGAQAVTVTAGAEVDNIFFTVQSAPAFRVSGIVVDEAGAPVPDAMVTLTNDPRRGPFFGSVGSGRSDASGRFAIEEVPAGSYRANASIMIRSSSGGVGMALSGGVISWTSGPTGIVEPAEIVVTDSDVSDIRVVARRNSRQ
jgi:protocatechuate 3,4-dioxygenase beta subunit